MRNTQKKQQPHRKHRTHYETGQARDRRQATTNDKQETEQENIQ